MDTEGLEKAQQGRVTGVIIPPPEIRAVCDKTASFVAKFGKSFEQKVIASEEGKTPKFSFLKPFDPYHAYYENKIRDIEEGKVSTSAAAAAATDAKVSTVAPVSVGTEVKVSIAKASVANPLSRLAMNKPTVAPPSFEFTIAHPPNLRALDSEVIKMTAQYTAVNGRTFLSGIAQREQNNPQFDFLKPTHFLFSYFTALVDAYGKALAPSSAAKGHIEEKCNRHIALEQSVKRWQFATDEEERKRRDNASADAERIAFQQIDWSDFIVVETIDFDSNELLELDSTTLATDDVPPPPPIDEDCVPPPPSSIENEENHVIDDGGDLNVVSSYKPLMADSAGSLKKNDTMVDPVSGKVINVADMSEHMRIQLLDSRWKTEQQRFLDKQKESGLAEGASIADSLKNFASRRGDIFGSGEHQQDKYMAEEARRKQRIEETNQMIRESHSSGIPGSTSIIQAARSSVSAPPMPAGAPLSNKQTVPGASASTNPAEPAAPAAISVPVPVNTLGRAPIAQVQGRASIMPAWMSQAGGVPSSTPAAPPLVPTLRPAISTAPSFAPPMSTPGMTFVPPQLPPQQLPVSSAPAFAPPPPPPPPQPVSVSVSASVEPPAKKTKELLSEDAFISMYGDLKDFSISVLILKTELDLGIPSIDGKQSVELIIPNLSTTTKKIKDILCDQITTLTNGKVTTASNKIQLKDVATGFLKDTKTLASYNLSVGSCLDFSFKTRGGKK